VIQQAKYIPPVVVDSVKPEEVVQLMTADEAQVTVQNEEVVEAIQEVKEEVQEEEAEPEPFVVVEEMPMFPGGDAELLKYIAEHTNYPEVAKENNIQGRVIVRFCVTSKGGVNQVSVLKGVDPELDAEAIRVVTSLPPFKPGKQGGKPVPVWYMVPITFTLK
jgi:protein TonB